MPRVNWSTDEITLALALYLRTPYNRIHPRNPEIQKLATYLGRTEGAVSKKLANLACFDPEVAQKGKKGFSHGSKLDPQVWNLYVGSDREISLDKLIEDCRLIGQKIDIPIDNAVFGIVEETIPVSTTEEEQVVKIRRGQAYFRQTVLCRYRYRCVVSGLNLPQMLEAAHILPWSDNETLRLVPQNGLALLPSLHKAYDLNLLGIDADGVVHISDALMDRSEEEPLKDFFKKISGQKIIVPSTVQVNREYLDLRYQTFLAQ